MKHCLIIARHSITAKALRNVWLLLNPQSSSDHWNEPVQLLVDERVNTLLLYEILCNRIDAWLNDLMPTSGVLEVLVDEIDCARINLIAEDGWPSALSMAILTFPDIYWRFGCFLHTNFIKPTIPVDHGLAGLIRPQQDPLMDFTGLRSFIRERLRTSQNDQGRPVASYIPLRSRLAAALDDEIPYAYLHAYAAYRNGFLALPVTLEGLTLLLFRRLESNPTSSVYLTFEDIYLSFADNQDGVHYSDLNGGEGSRANTLPRLSDAAFRIFVSSDHRHLGDEEKHRRNELYIGSVDCARTLSIKLRKPLAGLFDLWKQSKLDQFLLPDEKIGQHRGHAPGFVWPPQEQVMANADGGHSAPGRLLLIAERLIERARRHTGEQIESMSDAIFGAVLAIDAVELVGDRTPTTAIEALKLKHQFEIEAECFFSGVEYHIAIRSRMQEITSEVTALSRWFSQENRIRASQNAEMRIISNITRVLHAHSQFDEEQACANRVRHLHNSLWMSQNPSRYIVWPLVRYIEFLLTSFPRFLLAIASWIFVLALLYSWQHVTGSGTASYGRWHLAFEEAVTSFFSIGAPIMHRHVVPEPEYISVVCLTIILGFVHLGVFVSHLYATISRR